MSFLKFLAPSQQSTCMEASFVSADREWKKDAEEVFPYQPSPEAFAKTGIASVQALAFASDR